MFQICRVMMGHVPSSFPSFQSADSCYRAIITMQAIKTSGDMLGTYFAFSTACRQYPERIVRFVC